MIIYTKVKMESSSGRINGRLVGALKALMANEELPVHRLYTNASADGKEYVLYNYVDDHTGIYDALFHMPDDSCKPSELRYPDGKLKQEKVSIYSDGGFAFSYEFHTKTANISIPKSYDWMFKGIEITGNKKKVKE